MELRKTEKGYVFTREDSGVFILSYEDVREMKELFALESVKDNITDIIDDYDGDVIDIRKLDMSRDEFEQEVFEIIRENMKDGYYDGSNPSYGTIQDIVLDTAEDYGIRID